VLEERQETEVVSNKENQRISKEFPRHIDGNLTPSSHDAKPPLNKEKHSQSIQSSKHKTQGANAVIQISKKWVSKYFEKLEEKFLAPDDRSRSTSR